MADECIKTNDGVTTAKPATSREAMETYGDLSITEELMGPAATYTITTEYCHIVLRSGKSVLVDDRSPENRLSLPKRIELPEEYNKKVTDAVQAGLRGCKFDPANTLVHELFDKYLQPSQKTPPRGRY